MEDPIRPPGNDRITAILEDAYRSGREVLFEYEVYEILKIMGLRTPSHLVITDVSQISSHTLAVFGGDKIVIKAVSAQLTHKRNENGVRVVYKDLEFVKYSVNRMKADLEGRGYSIAGIMLVEFIRYSPELGNETLLGFRESEAFGPVISFSKGGVDAEHFAKYFSQPNLILAPIDRRWALALLESTKIQLKYKQEGKLDYISKIVDAGVWLSILSVQFSNFFESDSRFAIHEFEINPFVFDSEGNFIALDGYAAFSLKQKGIYNPEILSEQTMIPFFEPGGIAVVGVSAGDPAKTGTIIYKNLVNTGRTDVYGVNNKGGTLVIKGEKIDLYKSLEEIGRPIDLVVVTVPAGATLPVVEACARIGVKAVVLIPGGFGETGENIELEEKILSIAREHHIRLMGPNCLGLLYAGKKGEPGVNTFFVPEEKFSISFKEESDVAILSQSGALGLTEIYNLRHAISPRVVVSYGNQLDVNPADLINYLAGDPLVKTIGCYIEGFKPGEGRKFFDIASAIKKPVIVYKAGRTEAGRKATESHTASIAGEYEVARAAMKQAGLIVADTMLNHGDFVKTFALLQDFSVNGKRIAIIANAGYEKTYAADNLGDLAVAELDRSTLDRLAQILPPFVTVEPLLDLTPMAGDEIYQKCIEIVLESPSVDALCVSIVPMSAGLHTTDNEIDGDSENLAARIVTAVHKYKKPAAVSVNVASGADAAYNNFAKTLDSGGVPTFLTASRAMICLNEFIRYRLGKESGDLGERLK